MEVSLLIQTVCEAKKPESPRYLTLRSGSADFKSLSPPQPSTLALHLPRLECKIVNKNKGTRMRNPVYFLYVGGADDVSIVQHSLQSDKYKVILRTYCHSRLAKSPQRIPTKHFNLKGPPKYKDTLHSVQVSRGGISK